MVVAIGSDHGGYLYKELIKEKYGKELTFYDLGAHELDPADDYVDFSIAVAEAVASGKAERGIFICRTGVGASIAMNKVQKVFCGLAEGKTDCLLARKKNNINCLTFGADNVSKRKALAIVKTFLTTEFEGGRHQRRVDKIKKYESKK